MTGQITFSGVDWEEEEKRSKRGCAERQARKEIKKDRKKAMAEQARIRGQVRNFLRYLSGIDDQILRDHLISTRFVAAVLLGMYGDEHEQDLATCIDRFVRNFVVVDHANNGADLNDWEVVLNLQTIMIQFVIRGLYDDPVSAAPNAADGELTSDSSGEQKE